MAGLAFLEKKNTVARPGYSKWLIPPAALCVHLSIGQVYAFSVFKASLVQRFESSQTAVAWIFSIAIVMLGLSAAVLGTWVERNGPRKAMVAAGLCWSTGFLVGSLGIAIGSLPLLYLGYGVIGGIGLGIGYISPVSTLIKWFPDKPGLATGMAIMGFGGGALIASPLSTLLLGTFDPGFDPANTDNGASASALASTFLTLGLVYLVFMMIGAALIRLPPGFEDDATAAHQPGRNGALVRAKQAIRTPQFALLWVVLFCNVTAGIGILEQAAPMIQDFFRDGQDSSVSAAEAAGFVGMLSLANMAGRFVWSSLSDRIGRKPIYMMYLGVGLVLYVLLATIGQQSTAVFVVLALVIISYYGGGFATVPAYLKDLFGTLEVGAIHGRLLTAWAAAGVMGPLIVNGFLDAAGEPGSLVASDYHPALITMVVVLAVGFVANLLVKPVDEKHFDQDALSTHAERSSGAGRSGEPATSGGTR
ncbi:MFS-type transporter involved in bile tolerance, Atg22 family [Nocardioides scoriae]|uniref:MFS-type transporter involved in bile tolerance, Atg22 family n=1 Tax=Nocardioides scoriae TaxID=642780 RepID=A0A1H1WHX1_9ACTN|nr:OFA family MFS transporter [Nocardioides scoriae]SDS96694.1 MFS-type transporter involved in bile tolerance, Atg22 family [Nocardioides scoriae]